MILTAVTLENFRCYKGLVRIPVNSFTALVGRNDSGKSSILEALDIFFNEKDAQMESADSCVFGQQNVVRIGCSFRGFPTELTLDDSATTTLEREHLLNSGGELEIVKEFDCLKAKPKGVPCCRCMHPTAEGFDGLLSMKQADLRRRARELGLALADVDERKNCELRTAIWGSCPDLAVAERLVSLDSEGGKSVWTKVQDYLPRYALFRADRKNSDGDDEVQDPMNSAVALALDSVREQLLEIQDAVKHQALGLALRTIDKLRELDPQIAASLVPDFAGDPKWGNMFKVVLKDENGISVNKRGSGTRRLILLSFFRVEAERTGEDSNAGTIYAVEEPETSQHPANQKRLLQSLQSLSEASDRQVIITTHSPSLAGRVAVEDLRYVRRDDGSTTVRFPDGQEPDANTLFSEIASDLGVLPDSRIRCLMMVEGPNDVEFFWHMSAVLRQGDSSVPDLSSDPRVAFIPVGGSTLAGWVSGQYLKSTLPVFALFDSDNPQHPHYQEQINQINARTDGSVAFSTTKRELENYLHADAIKAAFGPGIPGDAQLPIDDMTDVPELVARAVHTASGSPTPWDDLDPGCKEDKERRAKRRLNRDTVDHMTRDLLHERDLGDELIGRIRRLTELMSGNA